MKADPASAKVAKGGWHVLALVCATQMLSLLDRNILAILNPRIKADLHIGDAEMGLLYGTVFALFYALFSLPLGRLADGWLRGRLLAICIAFWSIATGFAAFAAGFAMLALSRLAVGIGEAASQPAGTSLVYDYFPKSRRGFVMAILGAGIAVGLGLSSILGGVVADWWDARFPTADSAPLGFQGWQFAFVVAASPGELAGNPALAHPRTRAGTDGRYSYATRSSAVWRQRKGAQCGFARQQLDAPEAAPRRHRGAWGKSGGAWGDRACHDSPHLLVQGGFTAPAGSSGRARR